MKDLFRDLCVVILFLFFGVAVVVGALLLSGAAEARPVTHPPFDTAKTKIFMRCLTPRVYDGDTIVCASGYHLRLLGVQAPEIKCKLGIECIPGDALGAKAALEDAMKLSKRVTYQYIRRDNRNRPVVIVRAGKVNLNCYVLQHSDAVLKWDHKREIETECGVKPVAPKPVDLLEGVAL
jgi:endonuclease YncB( thermonuclease family)